MIFFKEKVQLSKYEEKDTHAAISNKCKKGTIRVTSLVGCYYSIILLIRYGLASKKIESYVHEVCMINKSRVLLKGKIQVQIYRCCILDSPVKLKYIVILNLIILYKKIELFVLCTCIGQAFMYLNLVGDIQYFIYDTQLNNILFLLNCALRT